jgi:hypothetical protein
VHVSGLVKMLQYERDKPNEDESATNISNVPTSTTDVLLPACEPSSAVLRARARQLTSMVLLRTFVFFSSSLIRASVQEHAMRMIFEASRVGVRGAFAHIYWRHMFAADQLQHSSTKKRQTKRRRVSDEGLKLCPQARPAVGQYTCAIVSNDD